MITDFLGLIMGRWRDWLAPPNPALFWLSQHAAIHETYDPALDYYSCERKAAEVERTE